MPFMVLLGDVSKFSGFRPLWTALALLSIVASLAPQLLVINYKNLNVDKPGLKQIMDWAVEGGILREPVDIDAFADIRFDTPFGKPATVHP